MKNRCSDGMSLLGISDLFWKILGSWENLRCSGEISPPGKLNCSYRNFPPSCVRKQKPPVKN